MNLKKRTSVGFLALLLFAIAVLTGCRGDKMQGEEVLKTFSERIEKDSLDDLTLTIYYIDPTILTRYPLSIDKLINDSDVNKIVITGEELAEHISLFRNITIATLKPVRKKSYIDARIYYVFESEGNRKLLDVILWGENSSMFINGLEIKENNVFYDVMMPILPEDITIHFGGIKWEGLH